MNNTTTSPKNRFNEPIEPDPVTGRTNWARLDAMSNEEVVARARTDPDNPPRTAEQLRKMKKRPRVFTLRRALRMSQEEFSKTYRIPLETIRDWEEEKSEPTPSERAYLKIIATDAKFVAKALEFIPGKEAAE